MTAKAQKYQIAFSVAGKNSTEAFHEGKKMLRKQKHSLKLMTGLVGLGLLMGLPVSSARAQGFTFSNSNYAGRYACSLKDDFDSVYAVVKYGPDGTGKYTAGTLIAAATGGFPPGSAISFPTVSPSEDYCIYTLDTGTGSFYNIDAIGTGFEQLTWTSTGTNNTTLGCPPNFVDQTAIGLKSDLNGSGQTLRADFVDANPVDESEAGYGKCLK